MKRMAALALIAALGFAGEAAAEVCTTRNTQGTWELVSVRAAEPGVQQFYAQYPVEYMRFKANGDYIYVARQQPLTRLSEIKGSLDRADLSDNVTYKAVFNADGVLIVHLNGQPFQGFRCSIENGQMIWRELPGNNALLRVQKRVQ